MHSNRQKHGGEKILDSFSQWTRGCQVDMNFETFAIDFFSTYYKKALIDSKTLQYIKMHMKKRRCLPGNLSRICKTRYGRFDILLALPWAIIPGN